MTGSLIHIIWPGGNHLFWPNFGWHLKSSRDEQNYIVSLKVVLCAGRTKITDISKSSDRTAALTAPAMMKTLSIFFFFWFYDQRKSINILIIIPRIKRKMICINGHGTYVITKKSKSWFEVPLNDLPPLLIFKFTEFSKHYIIFYLSKLSNAWKKTNRK